MIFFVYAHRAQTCRTILWITIQKHLNSQQNFSENKWACIWNAFSWIYHVSTDFISVLLLFRLCAMQSIFQLDSKLLALHSNFNFIQFVFTIYYLSVCVCILRFEGISLTFVHVSRIHRYGRAHTANTLVCINDFETLNNAQYTIHIYGKNDW